MNCPLCNVALKVAGHRGVDVNYCQLCGGTWLDRQGFENLAAAPAPPRRPVGRDAARGPYRRIGAGRLPARRRLDRRDEGVPGGAELDRRSARRVKDGPDDTGPVVGWCPWSRMVPVKAESREPCRSGYRPNRLPGSPSGCGTYSASASPGVRRPGRCGNRRSRRLGGVGVGRLNASVAAQSVVTGVE